MEKLKIGDTYSCKVKFSQQQVIDFAKVSGDNNPLHLDEAYASKTLFGRPIVHGFLSGSIFSKVIGTEFPGFGSIYVSQTMQFKRPIYVDTDYVAHFKIVEVYEEKHIGTMSCSIETAEGKCVLEGNAIVKNTDMF